MIVGVTGELALAFPGRVGLRQFGLAGDRFLILVHAVAYSGFESQAAHHIMAAATREPVSFAHAGSPHR
jgi:hypothetical protein